MQFDSDVRDPRNEGLYGPARPQKSQPDKAYLDDWLARTAEIVDKYQPDLIWFDNTRAYGSPSYHVQKLFGENRGDVVLPLVLDCRRKVNLVPGAIGLGPGIKLVGQRIGDGADRSRVAERLARRRLARFLGRRRDLPSVDKRVKGDAQVFSQDLEFDQ